jgi:hypothetical protein
MQLPIDFRSTCPDIESHQSLSRGEKKHSSIHTRMLHNKLHRDLLTHNSSANHSLPERVILIKTNKSIWQLIDGSFTRRSGDFVAVFNDSRRFLSQKFFSSRNKPQNSSTCSPSRSGLCARQLKTFSRDFQFHFKLYLN